MKKTTLIVLAAVGLATLASVPAMAQYGPPPGAQSAWDIGRRIQWTEDRIIRARDDGSLSFHEFNRVRDELSAIKREDRRIRAYEGGGIDPRRRADLLVRLDRLNDQIHWIRAHNEARPW